MISSSRCCWVLEKRKALKPKKKIYMLHQSSQVFFEITNQEDELFWNEAFSTHTMIICRRDTNLEFLCG